MAPKTIKSEAWGVASASFAFAQVMVEQFNFHSFWLGGLAFLGMVGTGLYSIWRSKYSKKVRGIGCGIFILAAIVFWVAIQRNHDRQSTNPPLSPSTTQHSEGDNSQNVSIVGDHSHVGDNNYQLPQSEPLMDVKSLILCETNGGEWHKTNDEQICLGDDRVLRNRFVPGNEYTFRPGIYNGSQHGSISRMTIFFVFPKEIQVRIPDASDPDNRWQDNDGSSSQRYSVRIRGIDHGHTTGVRRPVELTFTKPGRHYVTYIMQGETEQGVGFTVPQRQFYFELTE